MSKVLITKDNSHLLKVGVEIESPAAIYVIYGKKPDGRCREGYIWELTINNLTYPVTTVSTRWIVGCGFLYFTEEYIAQQKFNSEINNILKE